MSRACKQNRQLADSDGIIFEACDDIAERKELVQVMVEFFTMD